MLVVPGCGTISSAEGGNPCIVFQHWDEISPMDNSPCCYQVLAADMLFVHHGDPELQDFPAVLNRLYGDWKQLLVSFDHYVLKQRPTGVRAELLRAFLKDIIREALVVCNATLELLEDGSVCLFVFFLPFLSEFYVVVGFVWE